MTATLFRPAATRHTLAVALVIGTALPAGTAAAPGPVTATAAAAPIQPLTLQDAVARGLEASHRLAELRAREAGARASLAASEAAERPMASAQAGYARTNHVQEFIITMPGIGTRALYPDVPDTYRTRLDLQWPIYTAGRTDALQRAASAEIAATRADLDAARADLRLEISRAYWAVLTATDTVTVLREGVRRAGAHLTDMRHAFQQGLVPPNDVSSVEAQQSRQRMLLVQAESQRDVASAVLARLVGLPLDTPLTLDATLEAPPVAPPPVEALAADARAARGDRVALERRRDSAIARREAAARGRRPTVGVGGGYDLARPNPRVFPRENAWNGSWDASVNVNWPWWDGGRTRAAAAEADAVASAAGQRLAEFDTILDLEVRQRVIELASAGAAVQAARDAVAAATDARRVVEDRFNAGVATNTDVLDAQVALLQSELDRTRALADVRLAEARLARAVGR